MRVTGVDACPGGWVAVDLDDGQWAGTRFAPRLEPLITACPAPVGVDMPLGLLARGWRRADDLAAARLGRQHSRVFRVPPRPALLAATHAAAVIICRRLTDPPAGFSIQAWGLREKILEADLLRAGQPGLLHEVHPELSFARLAGGHPVAASKKTWNGQMTRRALLAAAGIRLPDSLPAAGQVPPDDILDAAAVAWTTARIAAGQAAALPPAPQPDDAGHPITIWS
jgi:predicted RNase H-like nuclease